MSKSTDTCLHDVVIFLTAIQDNQNNPMSIGSFEHLRIKPMWAGSSTRSTSTELITFSFNDDATLRARCKKIAYLPDAISKCYDELIVNAVDHIASCRNEPKKTQVSYISITFDIDTLRFTIENDGRGVDVSRFPKDDDNFPGQWKPYVYFTCEKQGTNAFKDAECIKAGVNGYGSKVVIAHAEAVTVTCVNATQKRMYTHTHRNNPKTGKYEISTGKVTENYKPERTITLPDGWTATDIEGSKTSVDFTQIREGPCAPKKEISGGDVHDWLMYRLIFIAPYIRMLTKTFGLRDVHFVYQFLDEGIVKGTYDLSGITFDMIADSIRKKDTPPITFTLKPAYPTAVIDEDTTVDLYPIEVTFFMKELDAKTSIISNTNGTLIEAGGHLDGLFNQITDGVIKKILSKIDNSSLKITRLNFTSTCMMLVNAIIPGVEFGEQAKKKAQVEKTITEAYKISHAVLQKITKALLVDVLSGSLDNLEKKAAKKAKISDKYDEAPSRARNRSDFILVIAEGDSAKGALLSGISSLDGKYDIDKIGYMTLHGGVPNSRKKSFILTDREGNERIILDDTSMNNVFLNTLQKALGIQIGHVANRDSMRYGRVVCCVDQDHDGKGKLFGLVMNIFAYFWPELLDGTFLYKLEMPILRVYPSEAKMKKSVGALETFYYEHEMEGVTLKKGAVIKYYKGLGSYSAPEMRMQCASFFENLRGIRYDSKGDKFINDFYGKDSEPRKRILSKGIEAAREYYDAREKTNPTVKVSDYLMSDVFLFAKDDISRKLPSAIDGLNDSGRKVTHALICRKSNRTMKLPEFAGYVQQSQNYHHGEMCLEESIKGKCLITVGGTQLPLLIPDGHFGNRLCGGKTAAASRYVKVTPNAALIDSLFPSDDLDFLKYTIDDGSYYEPDYLAPIIPMAILETVGMPSHGWNYYIQARDVLSVIERVRRMIRGVDSVYRPIPMETRGFTGDYIFNPFTGEERTIGRWELKDDDIIITEVPIGTWLAEYRLSILMKIIFYGLPATIGQPKLAADGSFTLTIKTDSGFWDMVERPKKKNNHHGKMDILEAFMTSEAVGRFAKKCLNAGDIDEIPEGLNIPADDVTLVRMSDISKAEIEAVFGKDATKIVQPKKKKTATKSKTADVETSSIKIRTIKSGERYAFNSFLNIESSHTTDLNMINTTGDVVSFGKDYQAVIDYWFDVRRDLYTRRVQRQIILNRLALEIKINVYKYCTLYDFERRSEEEGNKILSSLGIKAINVTKINNPRGIPNEELEACISDTIDGENTYDYLWKMSVRDTRSSKKVKTLMKTIIQMTTENAIYESKVNSGRFVGSEVWLDELGHLEKIIIDGQKSNWGQ